MVASEFVFCFVTACIDFTTVWQNILGLSIYKHFFLLELDSRLDISYPLCAPVLFNFQSALGARWGKFSV